ncbi:hypothetical protein DL93DRAFT_2097151 [Clavulina sp. PMI_390]|nr:hypothetical protein DL93DRAFT_2097151 [Clavulina sp. PMI_390]
MSSIRTTFTSAILFSYDTNVPSIVSLRTTTKFEPSGSRTHQAHPEDYIEAFWSAHIITTVPQSSVQLGNPYVVFFQPAQRDLPPNLSVQAIMRSSPLASSGNRAPILSMNNLSSTGEICWRGNVLVAKYADAPFGEMIACGLNDLPIISRHFLTREPTGNDLEG